MPEKWEMDASDPAEYHVIEAKSGREFILRLTTGADVYLAIQKFAVDHQIRFAKIHAAFMGGFEPAVFDVWVPDTQDASIWHRERAARVDNLSMLLAMGGMIHPRPVPGAHDKEEPFPAIHFVVGGAWNVPCTGGHLLEGTKVKGVMEVFITEILGIEVLYPQNAEEEAPENWYTSTVR